MRLGGGVKMSKVGEAVEWKIHKLEGEKANDAPALNIIDAVHQTLGHQNGRKEYFKIVIRTLPLFHSE